MVQLRGLIQILMFSINDTDTDKSYCPGVAGIPYTMAMELRDGQGWAPDPSTIVAEGEEVWAFHEVAARRIIEEFGGQVTSTRQP